jgi:hypothetical protein
MNRSGGPREFCVRLDNKPCHSMALGVLLFNWLRSQIFAVLMVCTLLCVGVLSGQAVAIEAQGLDRQTRQLWERHWRVYAQRCAQFEGGFMCSPSYDKRYPSSTGMSVRQASAELSQKIKVGGGGVVVTKTVKMPIAEAEAMAKPIPKISVGQYGYLASVEVVEILGPKSMMVKSLYLYDPVVLRRDYKADRAKAGKADDRDAAETELEHIYTHRHALAERHKDNKHRKIVLRLDGFSTSGLADGDRWAGPKGEGFSLLIVKPETYGSTRRSKQRLVAISLKGIRWGLDESAFIELIDSRGLDPQRFVDLVMERMAEDDPKAAKASVFNSLLLALDKPPQPDESDEPDAVNQAVESGSDDGSPAN